MYVYLYKHKYNQSVATSRKQLASTIWLYNKLVIIVDPSCVVFPPLAGFPNDGKIPASPRDSSMSTIATASMMSVSTSAGEGTPPQQEQAPTNNLERELRGDSSSFALEQFSKKKKKKKDRGQKKDRKKKRKSNMSSKDKSCPSSSSLMMNNHSVEEFQENEVHTVNNTWENDAIFNLGEGTLAPPEANQGASATFSHEVPHRRQHDIRRASAGKSRVFNPTTAVMARSVQTRNDAIQIPNQTRGLDFFTKEDMPPLTGNEQHMSTFTQANDANKDTPDILGAAKQSFPSRIGNDDDDEVPHELLVSYMTAMGTKRDVAEEVASSFQLQQQLHNEAAAERTSAISYNHPGATTSQRSTQSTTVTSSNKLHEANALNRSTRSSRRQQQRQPSSWHDELHNNRQPYISSRENSDCASNARVSTPSQQSMPRYPASDIVGAVTPSSATIVEATPVLDDDIETDIPITYAADVEPVTFKSYIRDRSVQLIFCLGLIAVTGIVVGVLVATIPNMNAPNANDNGALLDMSMAPSLAPTFIDNDLLLAAVELSGFEVLSDPTSPQFKAVAWMSSVDQMETGGAGHQAFAQRYALSVIYFSFQGQDWIHQENWLTPDLHECEWSSGVLCDSNTFNVKTFDATRNNLQGIIPPEISLLTSSESFRIPKNSVKGTIPGTIGKLTSLSIVDLSENQITGPIPASFADAQDAISVNLSNNQLTSTIPIEFYSLKLLRTLVLTNNDLSGILSDSLVGLSSLVTLDLRENRFSGTIPSVMMDDIKNLDFILLDYNRLTGPLPTITNGLSLKHTISLSHNQLFGNFVLDPSYLISNDPADFQLTHIDVSYNLLSGAIGLLLGFLPTLRYCDITGNSFVGTFPSAIGFDKIEFLALGHNLLTGTIPIGYPTLTHLDVSNNFFTEGIPDGLCDYPVLEFLILSGNQLESTIPECLGAVPRLRAFEIANCSLIGTIPPVLGQLSDLSILDFSDNILTSTIPSELGDLTAMEHLQLHDSSLTGSIPSELGKLVDLITLNLAGNSLMGMVPPEFEALEKLESLVLHGNFDLQGIIPAGLCGSSTLRLQASDIGCDVICDCCSDTEAACDNN